ncbi:MAG: hypothetical protein ACLQHS_16835 [Candidatus Limnocylindrales bacterium]
MPLSNDPSSAVTVCETVPVFVQVTVVPTVTVSEAGVKPKSTIVAAAVLPAGATLPPGAALAAGAAAGADVAGPPQAAKARAAAVMTTSNTTLRMGISTSCAQERRKPRNGSWHVSWAIGRAGRACILV